MREGGRGAAAVQAARTRRTRLWRLGAEHTGGERTQNMCVMLPVTLDVSKLTGWLNAVAFCRVERRAAMQGELQAGRGEGVKWWRRSGRRACAERTPRTCCS